MSEYMNAFNKFMIAADELKANPNLADSDKERILEIAKNFIEARDTTKPVDPLSDERTFDTIIISETLASFGIKFPALQ
ncbi:MAG: hypothetical protein PHX61_07550 [Alphaproteobacteria bacterium]|nr:hypothetical protein [Alphaproteobacteria bacterium]